MRGCYRPFPERHRKVLVPVRMILWNFQPKCRELHEVIGIHPHKAPVLRRKHQGWRTAEIYKAEVSFRANFTVKHGRDFARLVVRVSAQSIAGGNGLRKTEIDYFEQLRGSISVTIMFGVHKRLYVIQND